MSNPVEERGEPTDPVELHVAGATVRHQSPFADLEVPVSSGPLSAEIRDDWVIPLYWGLDKPHIESFLAMRLPQVTDELVDQLLRQFDWRPRTCGAYLAALTDRTGFLERIGRLLLRSDVCYVGSVYCQVLAEFNKPEGNQFLDQYLGYYLQRKDLWFDQGSAMGAVAWLDRKNGTARLAEYLPLWQAFNANKGWDLERDIAWFETQMGTLQAFKRGSSGRQA